jgi:hypothetical protein
MNRWIPIVLACGLFPGAAMAQTMTVQFGPPAIRWEARPAMVVIAPGVWVVEDSPDEVFYYNNWYWTQDNGHWYRTRSHNGHWRQIDRGRVPSRFHAQPAGHYRHHRAEVRNSRTYRSGGEPKAVRHAPSHKSGKPKAVRHERPGKSDKPKAVRQGPRGKSGKSKAQHR